MQGYNCIAVFNEDKDKVLMCKRKKNPYMGLSNFVGGKIEPDEDGIDAAYRELWEETGITRDDVTLTHFMDFTYHLGNCCLEVYVGRLNKPIEVGGDENELHWSSVDNNFFDTAKYAGEGNLGHIMMHIEMYKSELLK